MNNKGYTIVELLILIVFLGIITFIGVNKVSYAFDDTSIEAYNSEIKLIKTCAKKYGESKKDEVRNSVTGVKIKVNDLIEYGCLKDVDKNGKYLDPRDDTKSLNDLELNLSYNPKNDSIESEVLN